MQITVITAGHRRTSTGTSLSSPRKITRTSVRWPVTLARNLKMSPSVHSWALTVTISTIASTSQSRLGFDTKPTPFTLPHYFWSVVDLPCTIEPDYFMQKTRLSVGAENKWLRGVTAARRAAAPDMPCDRLIGNREVLRAVSDSLALNECPIRLTRFPVLNGTHQDLW